MEIKKKRTSFLFGAGAVLPWGAPSTPDLTELIRKSGFNTEDNKTTITEYIFQKLKDGFGSDENVNFETLINVIEELIVYNSKFKGSPKLSSLISCIFTERFDEEIYNFSIKGGVEKRGYEIDVPRGMGYNFSKNAYNSEKPRQFFLLHQLSEVLTDICARVAEYSYHSEDFSAIDEDCEVSLQFRKWIKELSNKSILRTYTLNYDRLFKILSEKENISMFEGFDVGQYIPLENTLSANVMQIIKDEQCNCHYNLHGSAFWEVLDRDKMGLPNPEIVLRSYPILPINNTASFLEVETGKSILISNIITGYQKAQKSFIPPFYQMQSAFNKDCLVTDVLYIVGYSFNDEHINQSIKTALKYNDALKLVIIDPYFIKNKRDHDFILNFSPFISTGYNYRSNIDNEYQYHDGKVIVYTLKFEDYLTRANQTV